MRVFFFFVEKFKQMEIEKKKTRPTKRTYSGPIIRYHSLSMPLMEEVELKESADDTMFNMSGVNQMEEDE